MLNNVKKDRSDKDRQSKLLFSLVQNAIVFLLPFNTLRKDQKRSERLEDESNDRFCRCDAFTSFANCDVFRFLITIGWSYPAALCCCDLC